MKIKVVRVTATEFELEDGRIYQHPIPLNPVPTPEEFQKHYNKWAEILKEANAGHDSKGR